MFTDRFLWSLYLASRVLGQARYPFKPRPAIRRDQSRRVRRTVAYAYEHVPYYRRTLERLGLTPSDFKTADDLSRLPILERRQIQEAPEEFISRAIHPSRCLVLSTSGSSGAPLTVLLDPTSVLSNVGHQTRYRAVLLAALGRRMRFRETLIFSPHSSVHKHKDYWRNRTLGADWLIPAKQKLSMYDPPSRNVAELMAFRPEVIQSYGSYLEELFAYLLEHERTYTPPKIVGFGADGISESARRMMRTGFGTECFGSYNAVEVGRIGFECPEHRGYHINEEVHPLRIVDSQGRNLPAGENGEVIVSDLVNRAMVILNYRLGDIASLHPDPCPCGRTLPLMSYLAGRSDDWIELPSGRRLHPQAVHTLLREESEVWQYQVVQAAPLSFRLSLLAKETCDRERTTARLTAKFLQAFGEEARIEVAFVASLPRTAAGKVRPIVSLVRKAAAGNPGGSTG